MTANLIVCVVFEILSQIQRMLTAGGSAVVRTFSILFSTLKTKDILYSCEAATLPAAVPIHR